MLISDSMNVIVTSKKAILDNNKKNWYQKYIFRYQKWNFLLVPIELLISRIDISTSNNVIIDIKNDISTS